MNLELVFDDVMPTDMVVAATVGEDVRVTLSPQVEGSAPEVLHPDLIMAVSMAVVNRLRSSPD
jgi:hypothetical protein